MSEDQLIQLKKALIGANKMYEQVLPKFNWAGAFLSADDIALLNDSALELRRAVKALGLDQGGDK